MFSLINMCKLSLYAMLFSLYNVGFILVNAIVCINDLSVQ